MFSYKSKDRCWRISRINCLRAVNHQRPSTSPRILPNESVIVVAANNWISTQQSRRHYRFVTLPDKLQGLIQLFLASSPFRTLPLLYGGFAHAPSTVSYRNGYHYSRAFWPEARLWLVSSAGNALMRRKPEPIANWPARIEKLCQFILRLL